MLSDIYELDKADFPPHLLHIPQPPKKLYARGFVDLNNKKILTIVGPRRHSSYAKECIQFLVMSLRDLPVVIVSGLAHGIDSVAHMAALEAGLPTIAFPGSGLAESSLYPAPHRKLAEEILSHGGMLLSEFEPEQKAAEWTFPRRNRLVAGIAHAILIPEAGEKSGTLITARLACEYNRDLLVIPGNITNPLSRGVHTFLRLGATPITCTDDLREALGFERIDDTFGNEKSETVHKNKELTEVEKQILVHLYEPCSRDILHEKSKLSIADFNAAMSMLEIKHCIKEEDGIVRLLL